MKKFFIPLFLSLLLINPAYPALTKRDYSTLSSVENFMTNGGGESGTVGWTVSGTSAVSGDLVTTTAAGSVYRGNAALTWTPHNADNFLTNTAVTITSGGGLSGANCAAMVWTKTNASGHALEAYDGSNVLATATIPSSTIFVPTMINWVCPASGTVQVRFNAGDTTALTFDDGKWGDARGINIAPGSFSTPMSTGLTFTPNNFGVVTSTTYLTRRSNDRLEGTIYFTSGTSAGSTASITLPTGYVIDSTKLSSTGTEVGHFFQMAASGTVPSNTTTLFYDGADTSKIYFAASMSSAAYAKLNGSSVLGNTTPGQGYFSIPIATFTDVSYFNPSQTPASWSGYQSAISGGCSTASTTYANPSACTSIAVTQTTARNISCVQTGSSGSGIDCTLPRPGMYRISATAVTTGTGAGSGTNSVRLIDGASTVIDPGKSISIPSAGPTVSFPLHGIYNATSVSSAITFKLQIASTFATSGQFTQGAATGSAAIQWEIEQLDSPSPTPFLTGSVTCNSPTSQCRTEALTFGGNAALSSACTAGTCTTPFATGGVSSVTFVSTGKYFLNFVSGTFSAPPVCTCNSTSGTANDFVSPFSYNTWTATQAEIAIISTAGALTNDAGMCTCTGPH